MTEPPDFAAGLGAALRYQAEEPYHEYWYKLGKFVHVFSETEGRLLYLARELSGLKDPVTDIVFSGLRQESAKDLINKILDATNQLERKNRLTSALDQLSVIATIRNNIIHWGAIHDGLGKFFVSNAKNRPTQKRLKEFWVSAIDFDNMCSDLERINVIILTHDIGKFSNGVHWMAYIAQPWLYKPPQPSPPKNRPPQAAQSPKRQQRASRASQPGKE